MKRFVVCIQNSVLRALNFAKNSFNFVLCTLYFVLSFLNISHAEAFTAKHINDYGNVTVMEVTGNYDENNPDGTSNHIPRQEIAKEFFRTHKDEYDFLVIFSNFDFRLRPDAKAFYLTVKNDTRGIGQQIFDNTSFFGSSGKLQGTIDMGNISNLVTDPLNPKFEDSLDILSHELDHRWGAYIKFREANGNISTALLGKDMSHWSFLLNSYGSVLYGNQWRDNGNNTFTALLGSRKYYSPLDLYLMGFIDKSQVPQMLLIENPGIDPKRLPETGVTITGTPRYITIDDIIAAEGERIPNSANSQKNFKTAFIFITAPGTFTGEELYGIENIRNGWVMRFSVLNDGKGIMEVASTVKEDIPVNPGILPPSVTPRTIPPNIEDGVKWLMTKQAVDGSWMDLTQTSERDTAETTIALKSFDIALQNYTLGIQWLNAAESYNTDYLSRKIEAMVSAGQDAAALVRTLLSGQQLDGGWGSSAIYGSNPADTSFALSALAAANHSDQSAVSKAIEYLKLKQDVLGGWGMGDEGSTVEITANVLSAFNKYRKDYVLEEQISKGVAWLSQRQNPDGGFGNSPSTIYDSAMAVLALNELDVSKDITSNAVNYILNLQSGDGSWYESPYQTALAIEAVWKATVDPDLSIKSSDITFIPESITTLPSNIVINAVMWNSGRTSVIGAKVSLYDGSISEINKIGEQILSFPGQSSVTVTFNAVARDGNEHRFYIVVDPENLIKEPNKANNTALKILYPQSTYDFEILNSDITVSQNPVDIFKDVKITSKITNKGTMNAYNVQIKYYIEETTGSFDIATETVDIPANATITNEITWRTNKAGTNMPLTVLADPFNNFAELSETNNKASVNLTVNSATDPNLTVSYKDLVITPTPANERGNANISILVKNEGFSSANNIQVDFYKGVPGADGVLIGSQIIPSLNPGESNRVSIDWINIMDAGERIIYVRVDPLNQIKEIREDDNDAFTTLTILSLPDLAVSTNSIAFNPSAPKDGDMVSINITIKNMGEQAASNVTVRALEGNTLIGSQTIPLIAGNSQVSVSLGYNTAGKSGAHQITVNVDPENLITEQSEDNNTASRTLGVQNANLWLTEPYISPNGDGVKDSTQFFFRLDVQQTVKVVVVNKKGETVRSFSGAGFENVDAGNITWDGLNDKGTVVDDGQYQIKVVDASNNSLGSLLVIIDNNRSPLTDAIGTKYLLDNNLTCMLPDVGPIWLPDESGIVFTIDYSSWNTPEYPSGIYTMSPDAKDILQLVPSSWTDNGPDFYYSNFKAFPSPNGEKITFTFWKHDEKAGRTTIELWMVDPDGKHLTFIASVDYSYYSNFYSVKWSPDSKHISYVAVSGNNFDLWVANAETLGKIKIDSNVWNYYENELDWSPDSAKIAYQAGYYNQQNNRYYYELKVSDTMGNKRVIFEPFANTLHWLNNGRLVMSNYDGKLWLVDASGIGNHILVSNSFEKWYISPDRRSFAFTTRVGDTESLYIADSSGNASFLHELTCAAPYYEHCLDNIVWTSDSSKIAFVAAESEINYYSACEGSHFTSMNLVTYDFESKEKKSIPLPLNTCQYSLVDLNGWLADGISVIYSNHSDGNSITAVNTVTGDSVQLISYYAWSDEIKISPLQRYITYFKYVDQSNACYGRGNQDLWALSSMLNLTADLRAVKQKSAIILKGIAADLNFEGYQLEYADAKSPAQWNLIAPPSDMPVVNDVFTTWIPPYEGTFYVRLTVWDKAGNVAMSRKRVSWGLSTSITNIYKSREIFSPNGDGVKDTVELHYTVLEPIHLEFNIYDADNKLIRTFYKDHTLSVTDYISWDGRDSIGRIVPDGKYKIKIFDYEFFVEVDNTPPDVNLSLNPIIRDAETLGLYTDIKGHTYDKNLKEWIIEYGEGDNPEQWSEMSRGAESLVRRDTSNIIIPIQDVVIGTYWNEFIGFFAGKKLRITTEDFAGNKSTFISNFIEEKIMLYKWDDVIVLGIIPSFKAGHGIHWIEGVSTIRDINMMNLQYKDNNRWIDVLPGINVSGSLQAEWDNSIINEGDGFAVRLKAVDILGREYYSNELYTQQLFSIIPNCIDTYAARISILEPLTLLQFLVQSNEDANYSQWTAYKEFYDPLIPQTLFPIFMPLNLQEGKNYQLRMIGRGVSNTTYTSNDVQYPPSCHVKISMGIKYGETECGFISGKALISSVIERLLTYSVTLRTMSYYIQMPEGLQPLRQFDAAKEGTGSVEINTAILPEGSYPIKAVLSYLDLSDNQIKEVSAANTLIVDRVLPTAEITYPGKSLTVCPMSQGGWYGIPIEGVALDNTQVKRYELYYGVGEKPDVWLPAMTRDQAGKSVKMVGYKSVQGQLGIWDVTNLKGETFSLKLKVIDIAGNVSCYTTSFNVDNITEIANLTVDKSLISPNGDSILDDVKVNYLINEYATIDVKVFKLLQQTNDTFILDATPVRTIVSGLQHLGGLGSITWDGKGDSGAAVPDGKYGIAVYAKDSCGNANMKWVSVEVDNTPPMTVITYPRPPDALGNIVEVKGTANDLHFKSYILEAGQGDAPTEWILILSGINPIKNNILGKWNTFNLSGRWTLRLSAYDTVGNKNFTTVAIDLAARVNLIKDFSAMPQLFSPNNDAKLESTTIKYELTDACQVKIDMLDPSGAVRKSYTTTTPSAGIYTYEWRGKDNADVTVPDGVYSVQLTAALLSNTSVTQAEKVTVVVDTTPPAIDIPAPVNNSYINKTDVPVSGTITDTNLSSYSITYAGSSGPTILDAANQNRESYTFGIMNELPEGYYTLSAIARDLGENETVKNIAFTIDRTPPKVAIDTPKEGEFYGNIKNIINITGSIVETNLETYSLRYALGNNPSQWIDLLTGSTVPTASQLFSWKAGKTDGIPDGLYTISLYAKDKAGLSAEAKVKVTIDNTPPEVSITLPLEGSYIKAATDIKGTAFDQNLDKYTLELSEGECASAFKWSPMKTAAVSVRDSALTTWQALPSDGNYCIRLTAVDKLENKSEARINVKVDTHPPAAPVLSGKIENKSSVRLTWPANTETDLAGYDLYRDGQKINTALIKDISYLDQNLNEGVYAYTLKAIDFAGNESQPSNEVKLKIDLTGPDARIRLPQDNARVSDIVDIKGTAYSADDFKQYKVYTGQGANPSTWTLIRTSPLPTSYGTLAQWDTITLTEGQYSIKLEAEDISGNINTHQITVTIDNTPPGRPDLTCPTPINTDVNLTWQANTELDLAGYLLYRNDQLANVSGIVIGDLKPYLITGTTYTDKALPDGTFKYYLIAMDQSGNLSVQSRTCEITIETRPPHATIVEPLDKSKFDNKILVKAEAPDLDIARVQFQYKKATDTVWQNLGSPVAQMPHITYLDPTALSLTYGDYNLRAIATDKAGKTDPAPTYITITYTDITAPAVPTDLKALTVGKDVTLIWTANAETDFDGYNIYRTSGSSKTKITATPIKQASYQDQNLSDRTYTYEITAVDTSGNESKPSNSALARVYAPVIMQPYTPTGNQAIQLKGNNATGQSSVEIFTDTGGGAISQGKVISDATGGFSYNLTLSLGENRITAKATDSAGNISRTSDMIVVVYNETPAAPTGLTVSVNNYVAALTWNPNAETDISGYNLFRNGEKINAPVTLSSGNATASSYYSSYLPSKAFDGNSSTYWMSNYSYGAFTPQWLEIDLPAAELINHIEINWLNELYAGRDYEIQVWSGYAWITHTKVTSNSSASSAHDLKPSYRTDRIRIYITDTNYPFDYKHVAISEIKILKDNLIPQTTYNDLNLPDGKYNYKLTAVDYYGFESLPSDMATANVGDTIPPAAPINLTATASGADIILNWTANTEPDLTGYNIYKNTSQGWVKISASIVTGITYTDVSLPNGTYTYRITAVDAVGNESLPSNGASATVYVPDTTQPAKPVLFFPTVTGLPVTLYMDKTDISGFAEPDSTVELYRNGVSAGITNAAKAEMIKQYEMEPYAYVYVSPDGKMLFYELNDALWLKDIDTGTSTLIAQGAYGAEWSPVGDKFAYYTYDSNWNYHIWIYGLKKRTITTLTDDTSTDEYTLSWAPDGKSIAFSSNRGGTYDIWLKNLASGALTQVTSGLDVYTAKFSPDSRRLAYFAGSSLYILDITNGNIVLVDNQMNCGSVDWSPDGKAVSFVSYRNSSGDIYTFDTNAQTVTQVTYLGNSNINSLIWTPDGGQIVFLVWDSVNWTASIRIVPAQGQGQVTAIKDNLYLYGFDRIRTGGIAYKNSNILNILYFKGNFIFKDVQLESGENLFSATATRASGSISQPSDEISVTFDTSFLPDLSVATDDIYFYPAAPVAGQSLAVNIVVWNNGATDARDVEADVYIWDSTGKLELVKSEIIPIIASRSAGIIGFNWNTSGKAGANRIIVITDPQDKIDEASETNNYAEKDFIVISQEGVSMTTILNGSSFGSRQDVNLNITVMNSNQVFEGHLEAKIEDVNGYPVVALISANTHIPYGTLQKNLSWNTGSTFSGQYRAHSILRDTSGVIVENIVPFTILPDIGIISTLTTDKYIYGPNENVSVNSTIKNNGLNFIIPALTAKVRIESSANNILMSEDKSLNNLLPGATISSSSAWNAGLNAPGDYRAVLDIYYEGQLVSSKATQFKIESALTISGTITVSPNAVLVNNSVQTNYTVKNLGNADLQGVIIKVLIVDPETQAVMNASEVTDDLGMNNNHSGQFTFPTGGYYRLKTYTAILQYSYQTATKTLSSASFTVIDGIPPVVTIISPLNGSLFNTKFNVAVNAVDDASGVDRVEYSIDNGAWKLLPIADMSSGTYSTIWEPVLTDNGNHNISFRATDRAGNTSVLVSTSFGIDTAPPVTNITIGSPKYESPGNTFITGNTIISLSAADEFSRVEKTEYRIDGGNWTPYAPFSIPADGSHIIEYRSRDKAGNLENAKLFNIIIDNIPPSVEIISPVSGSYHMSSFDVSALATDAGPGIDKVEFQIDGGIWKLLPVVDPVSGRYSTVWAPLLSDEGAHTINFRAYDMIGNVSQTVTTDVTIEVLFGKLTAQPDPVYRGKDETLTYNITNNASEDITGLNVQVLIIDPDTQAIEQTLETITNAPMNTTVAGSFTASTANLAPKTYLAILQAKTPEMPGSKTLASATFEVKPGLEVAKTIPDLTNLLVWVNDKCKEKVSRVQGLKGDCLKAEGDNNSSEKDKDDKGKDESEDEGDEEKCIRLDLLENILKETATSYYIVYDKKDFERELRNPYFTDILILGDQHHLEDHYKEELREKVYSGTGIISALWLEHGHDKDAGELHHSKVKDPVFGVRHKGKLSGREHIITTINSAITEESIITAKGKAERIETSEKAIVAGWINKTDNEGHEDDRNCKNDDHKEDKEHSSENETHEKDCEDKKSPAIVLNEYGLGKAIYYAFDLGLTLNEENYNLISSLIKNSITYIHKPVDTTAFRPNQLIPVEVNVKSLGGAFDIKITESYPTDIKIYDPKAGIWITDNPWKINVGLNPNETKTILYYALTPDKSGTYSLQTEVGYMDHGIYNFYQNLSADLTIAKDTGSLAGDIISALSALPASGKDSAKINKAIKHLQNIKRRTAAARDMEKSIHDILRAIEALLPVTSMDISGIRLMMDEILKSLECRWYFH